MINRMFDKVCWINFNQSALKKKKSLASTLTVFTCEYIYLNIYSIYEHASVANTFSFVPDNIYIFSSLLICFSNYK